MVHEGVCVVSAPRARRRRRRWSMRVSASSPLHELDDDVLVCGDRKHDKARLGGSSCR